MLHQRQKNKNAASKTVNGILKKKKVCLRRSISSKTPGSTNTKHLLTLMQTFQAEQMGLNLKVMLSYHKWTYDAGICGSSLELMSHVVWGGS